MAFCSIREEGDSEGPVSGATLVKSLVSCCIDEAGVQGDIFSSGSVRSLAGQTRAPGQCATSFHQQQVTVPSSFFSCGDADRVGVVGKECSVGSQQVKQDLDLGPSARSATSLRGESGAGEVGGGTF